MGGWHHQSHAFSPRASRQTKQRLRHVVPCKFASGWNHPHPTGSHFGLVQVLVQCWRLECFHAKSTPWRGGVLAMPRFSPWVSWQPFPHSAPKTPSWSGSGHRSWDSLRTAYLAVILILASKVPWQTEHQDFHPGSLDWFGRPRYFFRFFRRRKKKVRKILVCNPLNLSMTVYSELFPSGSWLVLVHCW